MTPFLGTTEFGVYACAVCQSELFPPKRPSTSARVVGRTLARPSVVARLFRSVNESSVHKPGTRFAARRARAIWAGCTRTVRPAPRSATASNGAQSHSLSAGNARPRASRLVPAPDVPGARVQICSRRRCSPGRLSQSEDTRRSDLSGSIACMGRWPPSPRSMTTRAHRRGANKRALVAFGLARPPRGQACTAAG
jgi:hypothetical protein